MDKEGNPITPAAAKKMRIYLDEVYDEYTTTAIGNELTAHDQSPQPVYNGNIYNAMGQLVRQGSTSTEGLPADIYIIRKDRNLKIFP